MVTRSYRSNELESCPPKPDLRQRDLFTVEEAEALGEVFSTLSNSTRLRLLHCLLREDEMCVNDLAEALQMTAQAVSNQLHRMSATGILATRRRGTQIFYRLVDPCVTELLDHGFCLSAEAANRVQS